MLANNFALLPYLFFTSLLVLILTSLLTPCSCLGENPYYEPYLLGGIQGDTVIKTVDSFFDSTTNAEIIAFGGNTIDNALQVVGSQVAIVGALDELNEVKWLKTFNPISANVFKYTSVSNVVISNSGTQVFLIFDRDGQNCELGYAYLDALSGSLSWSYIDTYETTYLIHNGNAMADDSDNIYLFYRGLSNSWELTSFASTLGNLQVAYRYYFDDGDGDVYSVDSNDYQTFFIGGSKQDLANGLMYGYLFGVDLSGAYVGNGGYEQPYTLGSDHFYVRRVFDDLTNNYVHLCLEYSTSTPGGAQLMLQTLHRSNFSTRLSSIFQPNSPQDSLQCLGMFAKLNSSYYVLSYSNGQALLLSQDYSSKKRYLKELIEIDDSFSSYFLQNTLYQASFLSAGVSFLCGSLESLTSSLQAYRTFQIPLGFILPINQTIANAASFRYVELSQTSFTISTTNDFVSTYIPTNSPLSTVPLDLIDFTMDDALQTEYNQSNLDTCSFRSQIDASSVASTRNVTYVIGAAMLNYSIGFMDECETLSSPYSLEVTNISAGRTPSTFITFYSSTGMISVVSIDILDQGIYTLNITGAMNTSFANILLIVTYTCSAIVIYPTTLPAVSYRYELGWPAFTIKFTDWSYTVNYICGKFVYTVPASNTFIGINSAKRLMTIYSKNLTEAGVHTVSLTGTVQGVKSLAITFTVTIVDPCFTSTITLPTILPIYRHYLDPANITQVTFGDFVVTPDFCGNFTYSTIISQPFITFIGQTFFVQTNDQNNLGDYPIEVTGNLANPNYPSEVLLLLIQVNCLVELIYTGSYPGENGKLVLNHQYLVGNSTLTFGFSKFDYVPSYCSYVVEYNAYYNDGGTLEALPPFIQFSDQTFNVFSQSKFVSGIYPIQLVIGLNDETQSKIIQDFEINITANGSITQSLGKNQTQALNHTINQSLQIGGSNSISIQDQNNKRIQAILKSEKQRLLELNIDQFNKSQLSAYISQISIFGEITISFTDEIQFQITNDSGTFNGSISILDNDYLNISYLPFDPQAQRQATLQFWNATQLHQNTLTLLLAFDNPNLVSQDYVFFLLTVIGQGLTRSFIYCKQMLQICERWEAYQIQVSNLKIDPISA